MVTRFIQWFELRTGIYLHPRFVISFGSLLLSLILFFLVLFITHRYRERIQTVIPSAEEQAAYEVRMRALNPENFVE